MQCRCVCKSWYSLITSPHFISSHLRKTLTKNPQIFLHRRDILDTNGSCLLLFDNQDFFRSMLFHLPCPPHDHHCCFIKLVGSVNGLICFSIGQGSVNLVVNFLLCNPSIGRFLSIRSPRAAELRRNVVKGFGFDKRTQDYKILLIVSRWAAFIYSLNSNRWKRFTPKDWNWTMQSNSVVFVNGRFHWHVLRRAANGAKLFNFIMVLDVKCGAFDYILLPKYLANSPSLNFRITEYGESSIAIIEQTGVAEGFVNHVWMMKEYGSVESWIKLTVGNPQVLAVARNVDQVLGFRNKDEVFIRCANGCIASQKINSNKLELEEELKKMVDVDNRNSLSFTVHKYVPSLVLLDKENNVDVAAPTHAKRITTV